ncbi:MAG: tetratricopeptide repeat protein [Candidatus Longimicrobiales bacterium M2_2A_002]
MPESGSGFERFFRELKRRRVLRVAVVYIVAGWLVAQVSEVVGPALLLPAWTHTLVVVLLLLGFPVVVGVAWAFDITPEGVQKTQPAGAVEAPGSDRDETARAARSRSAVSDVLFGRIAVMGAILIVALAGISFIVFSGDDGDAAELDETSIAVLPFTVRGGDQVDVLAEGMVELLGTKLDGLGSLRATDTRVVLRMARDAEDPDDAEALARRLVAGYYVVGSVLEFGGEIRLQAGVYQTGQPDRALAQASAEGPAETFLDLVDDLAAELLTTGELAQPGRMPRIAALTTESLPALKAFLEGEQALRENRPDDAIVLLERAVEADTAFALAYYRMAVAAWWAERGGLARTALAAARRHGKHLSERDLALVAAFTARQSGRHADAVELYEGIVRSYPDDVEAWYELGEEIFHWGYLLGYSLTDSREAFERALALDPGHGASLFHLSNIEAIFGNVAVVDSLTRAALRTPGGDLDPTMEVQRAFAARDSVGMDEGFAAAEAGEESGAAYFFAMWVTDDLATVRRMAEAVMRGLPVEAKAVASHLLAMTLVKYGHPEEALAELAKLRADVPDAMLASRVMFASWSILKVPRTELEGLRAELLAWDPGPVVTEPAPGDPTDPHALFRPHLRTYLLALVENRLGRRDQARRLADELEALGGVDRVRTLAADLARHVRGTVALEEGRPAAALEIIEGASFWEEYPWNVLASPVLTQIASVSLRAEALFEAGRYREAIRWHRAISTFPSRLPYAHYRSAQAYEALDEPGRAASHYAEFIRLWEDADPALQPMVAHARERLVALTEETGAVLDWRESGEW